MTPPPPDVPPAAALLRLVTGYWIAQAVTVAARLGIADRLADGPRDCGWLATRVGADAATLYRLLRALASVGVFAEDAEGRFALTPMAECLRCDVPGSMHAAAVMFGEPWFWRPWADLEHLVRTGEGGFERTYGMPLFDYVARNAPAGEVFDRAMTALSAPTVEAVSAGYDFARFGSLVDVGGGQGSLLIAILRRAPGLRGLLFDRPEVVGRAREAIREAGLGARCDVAPGDFFEAVPQGFDAYLLKSVVHDWDDARSRAILGACHRAMASGSRLLLVEAVLAPGNDPAFYKWMDLNLLVQLGGCERTEAQYRTLLEDCGFRIERIVPIGPTHSVIEAIRLPGLE